MLLVCSATPDKNLILAQRVVDVAQAQGLSSECLELSSLEFPLYGSGDERKPTPEHLNRCVDAFRRAQGFVFCAPEYNGSIPPVFTNAITWLSVETDDFRALFNDKPGVIATHSGGGGQKVLISMRIHLSHLGVNVLGRELAGNNQKPVADTSINDAVSRLGKQLSVGA